MDSTYRPVLTCNREVQGVERLFLREKRVEKAPGYLLGAAGLCRGSGVTAAASSAAIFMAEQGFQVRYTECTAPHPGMPLLYDAAGFSERFCGRTFWDVYSGMLRDEAVPPEGNRELGVNWMIMTPESRERGVVFSQEQRGRLIRQGMRAELSIYDFNSEDEEWLPYMRDMDAMLVLVDPLPSRLAAGEAMFRKMKALELEGRVSVKWLVSRMCSSVSRRQIRSWIKSRDIYWIDDIGRDIISQNEYHCRFHWESEPVRSVMQPIFLDLFSDLGWVSDEKQL